MKSSSFEIIGNGVSLDVANGSRLTTEFVATTFNESAVFAGSYSYPITFPLTAKNIDFFEHGHHLENRSARKEKEVVISFFGMPWKTAIINYEVSSKGFEGALKVDNGAVADWMRETTLPDVFSSENKGKITHQSIVIGTDNTSVLEHIYSNQDPNTGYVWPMYVNSFVKGVQETVNNSLINERTNSVNFFRGRLYSPWFYHVWVIRKVCEWMGYEASGSYLTDGFISTLVIYNNGIRTGTDWLEQKKINPAEHLPKITIAEYFKSIRNDHRVMIYFDSLTKRAYFETCDSLLSSADTLDLSTYTHHDSIEIKSPNDKAFKLITKIDDSDELYNQLQYEKTVMVGYDFGKWKEMQLGIGRLYMARNITVRSVPNVTLPIVQQLGNIYSESYNTPEFESVYNGGNVISKNQFSLRMMSYKGLQSLGASSTQVHFCTGDDKGNNGVVYSNTLDQGGAKGIINQLTLQYYRFHCTSELVTLSVQMSVLDFFNMHPLQKFLIKDRNQAKIEALMDKVVFEPQSQYNIVGKISCYPNYDVLGSAQGMKVLVGTTEVENSDGVFYARLYMRNRIIMRDSGEAMAYHVHYDLYLEFYLDESGIIPYSVSNLNYKINYIHFTKYGYGGWDSYFEADPSQNWSQTGVANGVSHFHGNQRVEDIRYYRLDPELESSTSEFINLGTIIP